MMWANWIKILWGLAESIEILKHLSTVQGVPYFDICNSNVSWCEPIESKLYESWLSQLKFNSLSTVQGLSYFDILNSNVSWWEPFQLKHPIIEPTEIFRHRPIKTRCTFYWHNSNVSRYEPIEIKFLKVNWVNWNNTALNQNARVTLSSFI